VRRRRSKLKKSISYKVCAVQKLIKIGLKMLEFLLFLCTVTTQPPVATLCGWRIRSCCFRCVGKSRKCINWHL